MAHQSDIETEKYRQWVKAALGLKYLQEGLAPFCDDVSKQQHRDILDNIILVKKVPSVCGKCTLETLQPDHVKFGNKQCPLGQPNCNCRYESGKVPCPNNVCGAIYDSIINYHASTPPAPNWKNTQTQQWIADPWSIAKCFINAPGYEQTTSAADTNCTGLLHLIINNTYFHNHVCCNMTTPNILSKVIQYRNEIFHSSTMELDSQKTNIYIDDMIAVLQDGKELIHRKDAQAAVKTLQDLKTNDIFITEDVEKCLEDTRKEMFFIAGKLEVLKKGREDLKLKFKTRTPDLEEVLVALNYIVQNKKLTLAIDEFIERHLDPGALKGIEQIVEIIHNEIKRSDKSLYDLCIKYGQLYKQLDSNKEKLESPKAKGIPWTHDEYPQTKTRSESEWTRCIENKDEKKAYQLLEMGQLPDAELLDKACQTFVKSSLLKDICIKIEEKITASSDCIIYTNACYKETETDKIVFVVITRGGTDYVDLSKEKYHVLVRSIDYCSQEGRIIIDKEIGLRFEDSELEDIEVVLKDKSPDLMKKHSNLTLTTGSMFKSQNQGEHEMSLARKVCIVFFVTVKGFIPVGEDLLPTKLEQFDTDVREGRFFFAGGEKPEAKHKHLKIGCRISSKDAVGTIGGFVKHPEHGVCAITCAHIVLSEKEILRLRKKKNAHRGIGIGKKCFQPNYSEHEEDGCGEVVEVRMIEGVDLNNAGVDVALVKIDGDRLPTNGHFPDCDLSNIPGVCPICTESLHRKKPSFKNGTVLDTDEITTKKVVKYGQKTNFTIGNLKVRGGSVRLEIGQIRIIKKEKHKRDDTTFILHNMMSVARLGPGSTFAEKGDSGALVFSHDDNNKLAAIGILVGYDSATSLTLVKPICPVLEHVGLMRPFSLMNFDR